MYYHLLSIVLAMIKCSDHLISILLAMIQCSDHELPSRFDSFGCILRPPTSRGLVWASVRRPPMPPKYSKMQPSRKSAEQVKKERKLKREKSEEQLLKASSKGRQVINKYIMQLKIMIRRKNHNCNGTRKIENDNTKQNNCNGNCT